MCVLVSRKWSILQRTRKERIVEREDAEEKPDPPASRLRNACCSSLHITAFHRMSHSVFCHALYILLLTVPLHSLDLKTMSSVSTKPMVGNRLQGKSRASKEEQKGAREPIIGAVEIPSIIRHSRLSDIRLRLKDVMWSHGG